MRQSVSKGQGRRLQDVTVISNDRWAECSAKRTKVRVRVNRQLVASSGLSNPNMTVPPADLCSPRCIRILGRLQIKQGQ